MFQLTPYVLENATDPDCEDVFTSGVMRGILGSCWRRELIPVQIPFSELDFTYARSGGPGGQNVNKTNSAAILRWNLEASRALTFMQKERLALKLQGKLSKDGDLIIRSDVHRDQDQNRSECIRRLHETLQKALHVPKKRVATKPTRSSQRKRVEGKKIHSEIKSLRKKIRD